jgi:GT2 family glycosyltransferase
MRNDDGDRGGVPPPAAKLDGTKPTCPNPTPRIMGALSWSLVVATLHREECLLRSLRKNVQQSRPPKQVIVVDASADWERVRDRVLREVAPTLPGAEWIYLGAARRSLPYQRNRGLELCTSDIIFYLDDDAFMYGHCAEKIMRVYESDEREAVGGVSAALAPMHEPPLASVPAVEATTSLWREKLFALWDQEHLFLPYDGHYHEQPLSTKQRQQGLVARSLFHGCRMTFRTSAVRAVGGSDEVLLRTAFGEDCDLSYRVSRNYALVMEPSALLFHEQTPVARAKRALNTTLILLNAIALYRLHAPAERQRKRRIFGFLSKRLALDIFRDGLRGRLDAPCVRGALRALRHVPALLALDTKALRREYEKLQIQLCDGAS